MKVYTFSNQPVKRLARNGERASAPTLRATPFFTIGLGAATLILFFLGQAGQLLQYDRNDIAGGEFWRLITGHWTHWSFDHLWWCLLVFVLAGGLCEYLCRKGYLAALGLASFFIPAAAWLLLPQMVLYRGLSGLDSTVFVFAAVWLARRKYEERDWRRFFLISVLCLLFVAKLLFEAATGTALFVEAGNLFAPVPLVHLVGGVIGAVLSFVFWEKEKRAKVLEEGA
ncbi:MAG: rhombosortase [Deltaproteobacteria bacterium]